MKKLILAAVLGLFAFLPEVSAKNIYHCSQVNTKPWGCEYIDDNSAPNSSGGMNYDIRCVNPGDVTCMFSDGTCPLVVSDAIDVIEQQVAIGNFYGFVPTVWGDFSWTAMDHFNFEYTVTFN